MPSAAQASSSRFSVDSLSVTTAPVTLADLETGEGAGAGGTAVSILGVMPTRTAAVALALDDGLRVVFVGVTRTTPDPRPETALSAHLAGAPSRYRPAFLPR